MTGLIRIEQFNGMAVRFIANEGEQWRIPLSDIADALGMKDSSGIRKLFNRHSATLGRYSSRDILSHEAGEREHICLSEKGVIGLLLKIKPGAAKDPAIQDKIIDFQVWAIEKLHSIIKGTEAPARAIPEDAREYLKFARIFHEETGVSLGIAQAFALKEAGLSSWQQLLPASDVPTGYLTPTDIGNRIGRSAREVNMWLYQRGYQNKGQEEGEWRLTDKGKEHAEEFPFYRNGHAGYQIKWKQSVFALMNVRQLSESQTALSG